MDWWKKYADCFIRYQYIHFKILQKVEIQKVNLRKSTEVLSAKRYNEILIQKNASICVGYY